MYKDSSDRLIATTQEPKITLDELAVLKVADTGRIGAFLDWGLEKDLLLPFKEQTAKVKKGDEVLVALYVDKSGRLCATMKVYEKLRTDSPYKKDDHVEGIIYETSDNFGVFVAVDDCYSALIPKRMEEYGGKLPFNDKVDPEVIKQEFGLSKNAFKRAVGRLLKEGHIKISEKNIEMKKK